LSRPLDRLRGARDRAGRRVRQLRPRRAVRVRACAREARPAGRPRGGGGGAMPPQPVTAVTRPPLNAMTFPPAILQPPYFDPQRPLAMDYGAIGAIIGHEISHSFDDQGALFDDSGRLNNWA